MKQFKLIFLIVIITIGILGISKNEKPKKKIKIPTYGKVYTPMQDFIA